jgi:hypothetical protein
MELTPGERAVLNQLRELYANSSKRDHPLTAVTRQWPPLHYEAYENVLTGLVRRELAQAANNGQAVRITDAGLSALGVTVHRLNARGKTASANASRAAEAAPAIPVQAEPAKKSRWLFWVR